MIKGNANCFLSMSAVTVATFQAPLLPPVPILSIDFEQERTESQ